MKTIIALIVSLTGLLLAGCVEQPLLSDEEYNALKGPAPYSPDPMTHINSQPGTRPAGW